MSTPTVIRCSKCGTARWAGPGPCGKCGHQETPEHLAACAEACSEFMERCAERRASELGLR